MILFEQGRRKKNVGFLLEILVVRIKIDLDIIYKICWPNVFTVLILDTGFEPSDECMYEVEDMILNYQQMVEFFGGDSESHGLTRMWPNGRLPYTFDESVEDDERKIVKATITNFNEDLNGCLEIV